MTRRIGYTLTIIYNCFRFTVSLNIYFLSHLLVRNKITDGRKGFFVELSFYGLY